MTCNEFFTDNFVEISRTDFTFLDEDVSSENKGYDPGCSDVKREACARTEIGSTGTEGWSSFFGNKTNLKDLQEYRNK